MGRDESAPSRLRRRGWDILVNLLMCISYSPSFILFPRAIEFPVLIFSPFEALSMN
jgi:hypothetical protein